MNERIFLADVFVKPMSNHIRVFLVLLQTVADGPGECLTNFANEALKKRLRPSILGSVHLFSDQEIDGRTFFSSSYS